MVSRVSSIASAAQVGSASQAAAPSPSKSTGETGAKAVPAARERGNGAASSAVSTDSGAGHRHRTGDGNRSEGHGMQPRTSDREGSPQGRSTVAPTAREQTRRNDRHRHDESPPSLPSSRPGGRGHHRDSASQTAAQLLALRRQDLAQASSNYELRAAGKNGVQKEIDRLRAIFNRDDHGNHYLDDARRNFGVTDHAYADIARRMQRAELDDDQARREIDAIHARDLGERERVDRAQQDNARVGEALHAGGRMVAVGAAGLGATIASGGNVLFGMAAGTGAGMLYDAVTVAAARGDGGPRSDLAPQLQVNNSFGGIAARALARESISGGELRQAAFGTVGDIISSSAAGGGWKLAKGAQAAMGPFATTGQLARATAAAGVKTTLATTGAQFTLRSTDTLTDDRLTVQARQAKVGTDLRESLARLPAELAFGALGSYGSASTRLSSRTADIAVQYAIDAGTGLSSTASNNLLANALAFGGRTDRRILSGVDLASVLSQSAGNTLQDMAIRPQAANATAPQGKSARDPAGSSLVDEVMRRFWSQEGAALSLEPDGSYYLMSQAGGSPDPRSLTPTQRRRNLLDNIDALAALRPPTLPRTVGAQVDQALQLIDDIRAGDSSVHQRVQPQLAVLIESRQRLDRITPESRHEAEGLQQGKLYLDLMTTAVAAEFMNLPGMLQADAGFVDQGLRDLLDQTRQQGREPRLSDASREWIGQLESLFAPSEPLVIDLQGTRAPNSYREIKQLLERPVPPQLQSELEQRWQAIDVRVQAIRSRVDLNRSDSALARRINEALQFERVRLSTSVYPQGSSMPVATDRITAWRNADATMLNAVRNGTPVNAENITILNGVLGGQQVRGLRGESGIYGRYRTGPISPAEHPQRLFLDPQNRAIERSMVDFERWLARARQENMHPIQIAAQAFARLSSIHAFPDGSGRTSRLTMNWLLRENGYPPAGFDPSYMDRLLDVDGRTVVPEPGATERELTDAMERSLTLIEGMLPPSRGSGGRGFGR